MKVTIGMSPNGEDDKPEQPKKYHDHEIKEAADTLVKAEQIKKKPDLMVHVKKHLDERVGAIKSIKGLRAKYNELTKDENAEGQD